jgi:hypothetical protein
MQCSSRKRVFFERSYAKAFAKKVKSNGFIDGARVLRPYRCRECGFWHLTSSVPNDRVKVRW